MAIKTHSPFALRLLMTDDLYKVAARSASENPPPVEAEKLPPVFDYLGENNKFMLILVNEDRFDIIDPKDLELLNGILAAKKMEIRDVAVLNIRKCKACTFADLKQFFSCSSLILFGINPASLQLNEISSNQVSLQNGTKVLATFSFGEMRDDVARKRIFWDQMKAI